MSDQADVLDRMARQRAASLTRVTHPAIAAIQAGAGAELVQRAERLRMVIEVFEDRATRRVPAGRRNA